MIFSISQVWGWVNLHWDMRGIDASGQGMDTFIMELVDVREEFILEMPEMLLRLDSSANSIKGKPGCPLAFQDDGPIVNEGLESLSIFAHFKLLLAIVPVVNFFSINVEGFQIVDSPGVEDFPVL